MSANRRCHDCQGLIPDDERAVQALTKNAWMHFECWYAGLPFARDPETGRLLHIAGDPNEREGIV